MSTSESATAPPVPERDLETEAVRHARVVRLIGIVQSQGLAVLLLALVVYMWQASDQFMNVDNLLGIGGIAGALGVMAVAQTLLIVSGGLDISVGSIVGFCGVVFVKLTNDGTSVLLATIIALACGAAIGAINGTLVIKLGVNPLIATLGTMSIFSGLTSMVSSIGIAVEIDDAFYDWLGVGDVFRIPVPFLLFLAVTLIALVVERFTVFGRSVYAIGGNREAARLAGLRIDAVPFFLYVLSGLSAAVASLMLTSQLAAGSAEIGASYTLTVVTAVILGGASLAGGRGTVIGTLLAVLFLGVLQNGFTLLQVSSFVQTLILGIALIFAVLVDQTARKLRTGAVT